MAQESGRLLIVDDDPVNLKLLARHLERNGQTVTCVESGPAALEKIQSAEYDLVLLDVMMPGMDGFQVLRKIRETHTLLDLPVIIVTAHDDTEEVVKALDGLANDYVMKPIDFPVALARIQTHLLLRRLNQDLEMAKDYSDSLIESAYEMIISVDLERVVTQFNRAAERTFGYTRDEVIGKRVDMLYLDPAEGARVYARTLRENGFTGEIHNRKKNGQAFISSLSASVLRNKAGKPMGLMGISLDITEQKKLAEREHEVKKLKEEFLSIASHDLKNPLSGILGYAVLLGELIPMDTPMGQQAREYVDRIKALTRVMQKIIEDFLDFQALEDGQVRLKRSPTNLNELAETARRANEEYARNRNVDIRLELDPAVSEISADPDRIAQVINNLLNNGIKFGYAGGVVELRTKNEGDTVLLEVIDKGQGIREDEMDKLFMKYVRLSAKPPTGEKSSGLGLAISRLLTDLHGGQIGGRRNPDKGMTFWFRLPKVATSE